MSAPDSGPHRCPNCHAVATHHFCPKCGQPTTGWRAGIAELIHDFAGATLGADARIWSSLRELFRRPGALTVAYFEGRRFRYLSPLRLYLFASVLMFMIWAALPMSEDVIQFQTPTDAELSDIIISDIGISDTAEDDSGGLEKIFAEQLLVEAPWLKNLCGDFLIDWAKHMDSMGSEERNRAIVRQLTGLAPTALFLFLPFLAGIMRLVFWIHPFWGWLGRALTFPFRLMKSWLKKGKSKTSAVAVKPAQAERKFLYFDHFIFCLNFMSFLYLLVISIRLLVSIPYLDLLPTWPIVLVCLLYPPFYFVTALRRITGFRVRRVFANSVLTFFMAIPVAAFLGAGFLLVGALSA